MLSQPVRPDLPDPVKAEIDRLIADAPPLTATQLSAISRRIYEDSANNTASAA